MENDQFPIDTQVAVNRFASRLARAEAGKSQASIGDVRELLRRSDDELGGRFYALILEHETALLNDTIDDGEVARSNKGELPNNEG